MAGKIVTPIFASFNILERWICDKGVSRGTITSFLFSLMVTDAALDIKLSSYPFAMLANVFILHGIIIIPFVLKEPLEIDAAMSFSLYSNAASFFICVIFSSVSISMFFSAHLLKTTWVSTSILFKKYSNFMPYITPELPVIPTTILNFLSIMLFEVFLFQYFIFDA